jgi:hypothetical protein
VRGRKSSKMAGMKDSEGTKEEEIGIIYSSLTYAARRKKMKYTIHINIAESMIEVISIILNFQYSRIIREESSFRKIPSTVIPAKHPQHCPYWQEVGSGLLLRQSSSPSL